MRAASITAATLDARGELSRLRKLVAGTSPDATDEVDRLVDLLAEARYALDETEVELDERPTKKEYDDLKSDLEQDLEESERDSDKVRADLAAVRLALEQLADASEEFIEDGAGPQKRALEKAIREARELI